MTLNWLSLRADMIAGVTVFTVLVPSAMAYGSLAGVTPQAGLYAGMAAMIVYALLGSSRQLIIGPEATSALLTAMIVAPLAMTGGDPTRFAAMAAALAAMVGVILIVGGIARIGFLADFLPRAVLTGYMTGAALLVVQSQLGKLFHIKVESDDFLQGVVELVTRLGQTHVPTLLIGVVSIAVLLMLKRFAPTVPSALVVVTTGIVLSYVLEWREHGIAVVGEIPSGLPNPGLPSIGLADLRALLPGAASMAILAFSDAILTGRSYAAKRGQSVNANRELLALGTANLSSALLGAFPVAASGSRTAVNDSSGARTKLSGLFAAFMLIVFLLFFTWLLICLPVVVLAAIIIVAASGMIDTAELIRMYRFDGRTFAVSIVTFGGVIVLGIAPGILVAVAMSLLFLIAHLARPDQLHLGPANDAREFVPIGDGPLAHDGDGTAVYRLAGLLMFANANYVKGRVLVLVARAGNSIRTLIFDLAMSSDSDLTSISMLEELHSELAQRGIQLRLANVNVRIRDLLRRAGADTLLADLDGLPQPT